MGSLVELRHHKEYRGGLDCKHDTTGEISLYTTFHLADGCFSESSTHSHKSMVELGVMFHVAPFLPHAPPDVEGNQQLQKKRHLGNDIVIIVFK